MSLKKDTIIKLSLIIALLVIVACGAIMVVTSMDRDIREGKKFIKFLDEKDLIDNQIDIDSIEFIKGSYEKGNAYRTLASKEYGIDLDDDYNVVGFSNKALSVGEVNISQEQSVQLATEYVPLLYDGEVILKEFSQGALEEMPFYTVIFSKYEDGYPFYFDEITISIDKSNGKLVGFTNITTQGSPKGNKVIVSDEEAKNIAIKKFNETYIDGEIEGNITKAYALKIDQSEESILSYVVSIKGKQKTDKSNVYFIYFISTKSGEVIDSIRNSTKIIANK